MTDNWDQYEVGSEQSASSTDDWESYSVKEPQTSNTNLASAIPGLALIAGAGYGLMKTGIPQKVVSGAKLLGKGISNLPKVTNVKKGSDFAQTIRKAFVDAHADKVKEFGSKIDELTNKNPNVKVSLNNVVDELNSNWSELSPEAKAVIKKTPVLKDMVASKANVKTEVTLRQTQDILNYMNTKVPKNIRANNLDLIDALNNIRGSQLDAFPEMEGVRAEYRKFIEPYNNVKQYFKFNKLLDGIKNKFGGAEGQAAVEKVLPKDVINKIGGYRAAARLWQPVRSLTRGVLGTAPMVLDAINYSNDPNAYQFKQETGSDIQPARDVLGKIKSGMKLSPEEEFLAWKSGLLI